MSKHRFTDEETYAVWKAHGCKCFYCENPLRLQDATVDHIIPESLQADPVRLQALLDDYGLDPEFSVNDYANWVPADSCNQRKGASQLPKKVILYYLGIAGGKAAEARRIAEQVQKERTAGQIIGPVKMALARGYITGEEVRAGCEAMGITPPPSTKCWQPPFDWVSGRLDDVREDIDRSDFAAALRELTILGGLVSPAELPPDLQYRYHAHLGHCHLVMHRDEASREAFEVALRLQPENPRALVNLVIARSGCGEAPQALLADLAPALGLVPPVAEALHTQANLLIDAGCHHEALAVLQWPAVDPCSIDHRRAFCVARALWSLGDVGQAEEILRTCLSESSELPEVHELLADLLLTRAVPERSPFNRVGVPVDSVRIDRDLLRAAAASYGDAARRFVSQGRSQDAAKCWVNRACCLTEAGELDAARQAYADIDTAALPKWNGRSPLKNCLRSAPYRTGTVLGNSSRLLRHST